MYYEIAAYIAKEIIDVTVECDYVDGNIEIDISLKIPIAKSIEDTYDKLVGPS